MRIWPGKRRELIFVTVVVWVMLVLWMYLALLLLVGTQAATNNTQVNTVFLTVLIITVTGFSLAIAGTIKVWRSK